MDELWVGKVTADTAAGPPQPTQFLSRGVQGVIDGVRLGEFLVERMFATRRQRQGDSRMAGEVTDELEVIVAEGRLLRVAGDSDHTKHRVVGGQRHDDRGAFTDVGEPLDRILEGISDQRKTATRYTARGGAVHWYPATNHF